MEAMDGLYMADSLIESFLEDVSERVRIKNLMKTLPDYVIQRV